MDFANDYIEILQYGMKELVRFRFQEAKENRSDDDSAAENQSLEKWLSEY